MVPALYASTTLPSWTSTSMRRCPSIRVMGSMTIRLAIVSPLVRLRSRRARLDALGDHAALADVRRDGVRRDTRHGGRADDQPDRVGRPLDAEARERREVPVEGPVVPEAGLAAADAAVPRLDRVADAVVPADDAAGVVGNGAPASHLVQAVAALRVLVVERLDEESGVVVRPAVA